MKRGHTEVPRRPSSTLGAAVSKNHAFLLTSEESR
jgi:hypothetical protein